jgi:protein LTV1
MTVCFHLRDVPFSFFYLLIVPRRETITRPRNESKELKKVRKAGVKAERQTRRIEKKTTKQQFGAEVKDQKKKIGNKELRLKKL